MIIDNEMRSAGQTGDEGPSGIRPERLDRRSFLVGCAASVGVLGLSGCMSSDARLRREAAMLYAPVPEDKFPIPEMDISKVDPKYFRQTVEYKSDEEPGTIIVDSANYYVYRIEGNGTATRYGANVGRQGFLWDGLAYVGRKAEWPTWTPPKEMIEREPRAAKYAGGMPGGPDNPLGARTLYLYQDGVYTLYTIYASRYPETIGTNLTSGCTGLMTQDMIHLYDRTEVGTKVIVLPA